jgi:hypothetical protein
MYNLPGHPSYTRSFLQQLFYWKKHSKVKILVRKSCFCLTFRSGLSDMKHAVENNRISVDFNDRFDRKIKSGVPKVISAAG